MNFLELENLEWKCYNLPHCHPSAILGTFLKIELIIQKQYYFLKERKQFLWFAAVWLSRSSFYLLCTVPHYHVFKSYLFFFYIQHMSHLFKKVPYVYSEVQLPLPLKNFYRTQILFCTSYPYQVIPRWLEKPRSLFPCPCLLLCLISSATLKGCMCQGCIFSFYIPANGCTRSKCLIKVCCLS